MFGDGPGMDAMEPGSMKGLQLVVADAYAAREKLIGRGVEASITAPGFRALQEAAPTHVAGVRQFLLDLAGEADFETVGRVFNAVTDKLIEANPAADIR